MFHSTATTCSQLPVGRLPEHCLLHNEIFGFWALALAHELVYALKEKTKEIIIYRQGCRRWARDHSTDSWHENAQRRLRGRGC